MYGGMSVWGDESETLLPQTPIKLYSSTISVHKTIVKHERSKLTKVVNHEAKSKSRYQIAD